MSGVRDIDPGERELLEAHHVSLIDRPSRLPDALAGREVFVHLDVDVLDPSVMPGLGFPAPGGSSPEGLASLLDGVAGGRDDHRRRGHRLPERRGRASSSRPR